MDLNHGPLALSRRRSTKTELQHHENIGAPDRIRTDVAALRTR
jgi:hypothetical protein